MLTCKQKGLLAYWVKTSKTKITGADDLKIEQYQKLTDINDFDGFEKEINKFIHNKKTDKGCFKTPPLLFLHMADELVEI